MIKSLNLKGQINLLNTLKFSHYLKIFWFETMQNSFFPFSSSYLRLFIFSILIGHLKRFALLMELIFERNSILVSRLKIDLRSLRDKGTIWLRFWTLMMENHENICAWLVTGVTGCGMHYQSVNDMNIFLSLSFFCLPFTD